MIFPKNRRQNDTMAGKAATQEVYRSEVRGIVKRLQKLSIPRRISHAPAITSPPRTSRSGGSLKPHCASSDLQRHAPWFPIPFGASRWWPTSGGNCGGQGGVVLDDLHGLAPEAVYLLEPSYSALPDLFLTSWVFPSGGALGGTDLDEDARGGGEGLRRPWRRRGSS